MNANELADEFKNRDWDEVDAVLWCEKAATMLRQQQAEIEALKLQLHTTLTNRDLRTYDGKADFNKENTVKEVFNTEPVAWIANDAKLPLSEDGSYWLYPTKIVKGNSDYIPLYTHPAKTLTDEEIAQAWAETKGDILHRLMPFAKAILRKAQEK